MQEKPLLIKNDANPLLGLRRQALMIEKKKVSPKLKGKSGPLTEL